MLLQRAFESYRRQVVLLILDNTCVYQDLEHSQDPGNRLPVVLLKQKLNGLWYKNCAMGPSHQVHQTCQVVRSIAVDLLFQSICVKFHIHSDQTSKKQGYVDDGVAVGEFESI